MKPPPDRLPAIIDLLTSEGLMPPVKGVETVGGGVIHVRVAGTIEPELRARLKAAMGSARWKLVQVSDDQAGN